MQILTEELSYELGTLVGNKNNEVITIQCEGCLEYEVIGKFFKFLMQSPTDRSVLVLDIDIENNLAKFIGSKYGKNIRTERDFLADSQKKSPINLFKGFDFIPSADSIINISENLELLPQSIANILLLEDYFGEEIKQNESFDLSLFYKDFFQEMRLKYDLIFVYLQPIVALVPNYNNKAASLHANADIFVSRRPNKYRVNQVFDSLEQEFTKNAMLTLKE